MWVAVIAAAGVVLSASIQFLTNRSNVKAAERRESAVREETRIQRQRDHEAEAARVAKAMEEQRAVWEREDRLARESRTRNDQERWRDERRVIHEEGLTALEAYRTSVMLYGVAKDFKPKHEPQMMKTLNEINSRMALICSTASSKAFGEAQAVCLSMSVQGLMHGMEIGLDDPNQWWAEAKTRLANAIETYQTAAKADLGTTH